LEADDLSEEREMIVGKRRGTMIEFCQGFNEKTRIS